MSKKIWNYITKNDLKDDRSFYWKESVYVGYCRVSKSLDKQYTRFTNPQWLLNTGFNAVTEENEVAMEAQSYYIQISEKNVSYELQLEEFVDFRDTKLILICRTIGNPKIRIQSM